MGCDLGGTRGTIPNRSTMHPQQKLTLLWNQSIGQVKVQWKHLGFDEATWELEDAMREAYAFLF